MVHALRLALIFPASTIKRKMSMFNLFTAESTLGWGSLTSTLKGRLFGAMEHPLTSTIGLRANQATLEMKTVFIPWDYVVIKNTNGTM